ncbi:sensor histidine kinase [Pseudomonas leptonychotis]|uniref:sensor histidine kinase n=1 Tax=Pseudomonas leptonychotis TaxID=2448482 RepID=UPI0039EEA524
MSEQPGGLDFSTVIASTVHDMKNSLAMLTRAHAQWQAQLPPELKAAAELGVIDYEFARLNGMLVQMLGLYKLGVNQLPLHPGHHELDDFIGAQLARHQDVLGSRGIQARAEVESFDLMSFFDEELIGSVLSNIIANSIRYARSSLLISAREEQGGVLISVNDDGIGYPPAMIEQQNDYVLGLNQSSGSTGLGLYFSARIAGLHRRGKHCGHIELANGGPLGGGEFRIYLP